VVTREGADKGRSYTHLDISDIMGLEEEESRALDSRTRERRVVTSAFQFRPWS
jgi:hypothetical protein